MVLGLAAAREGLDDDHAATTAGAWLWQHAGFVGCCGLGYLWLLQASRHGEQLAGACDIGGAVAIGEQSVVSDAVEAVRQDVDRSPAVSRPASCSALAMAVAYARARSSG